MALILDGTNGLSSVGGIAPSTVISNIMNAYYAPINNTGAVSDVTLNIGQTVYIDFSGVISIPLHIACADNQRYEILYTSTYPFVLDGTGLLLLPNNTTIANAFGYQYSADVGGTSTMSGGLVGSQFMLSGWGDYMNTSVISTSTLSKQTLSEGAAWNASGQNVLNTTKSYWTDTTTLWTSLGTLQWGASKAGRVYIKRLL